ncbi:solute carrier family 22 member 7-like [Manduca sexta]|uniref:solute carrier family 22 member 7-like n=1 Tax=Manduca sexta TaxID=7130 RepID=UPI00188E8B56|nr:solute carrier family 22 member 7-like [Manduca sexta]
MDTISSESESEMKFDTVLNAEIGPFGKYQLTTIALLSLPAIFCACMAGDYIFTAGSIQHRCAIPQCDGPQPEFAPEWILNAVPGTATGFDNCYRYANATDNIDAIPNNQDICPAGLFDRSTSVPCDSFVYETTNTVVYDFNLECQEWLRTLPGTLNSLGGMVALLLAGYISDHFGRRMSIVIFCFNIGLIGLIRAFSVNYTMYVAFQFYKRLSVVEHSAPLTYWQQK